MLKNKKEGVYNTIVYSIFKVMSSIPEAKWSSWEQVDGFDRLERTELVYVEKYWDDFQLGVKG